MGRKRIHREKIEHEPRYELRCYASGSGALSFTWLDASIKGGQATGRKVTMEEAQAYLDGPEGKSLKEKNYRVVSDWGRPLLVANIRRIDERTLDVNGQRYDCTVRDEKARGHDWLGEQDFTLTTEVKDIGVIEVKNVSTKAAVRHFLENESWLQPKKEEEAEAYFGA